MYATRASLYLPISIHAPREGSDTLLIWIYLRCLHFNPRSPRGERPQRFVSVYLPKAFQSTLPARGATSVLLSSENFFQNFNPRSPRGERPQRFVSVYLPKAFQSTLPARGATSVGSGGYGEWGFQSTLPARGATLWTTAASRQRGFQSTLPARGATCKADYYRVVYSPISIHAPREGSDHSIRHRVTDCGGFQSTLPARGATNDGGLINSAVVISIHAPREGSDRNIAQIFTIRTAILQHGYQTRLVFGTKSIVLNRKKSFKLPVFLREPTGLFMFTSGSRHGRSKNQRVGHIYGGACTDVLNLSLI